MFVDGEPLTEVWSVGSHASVRLTWCDSPELPDDLVVHDVVMQARLYHGLYGQPHGQLVNAGTLTAARPGHYETGEVTLSGCLYHDRRFHLAGGPLPAGVLWVP